MRWTTLLIEHPWLSLIPVVLLLGLWAARRSRMSLVAAVLWRMPGTGNSPQVQINGEAPIEIVELAAEGEDFELMTEDPEFYTWVADQAGNGVDPWPELS